jgi:hypothetical protein
MLERSGPVLDDFALPLVEEVGLQRAMLTRTVRRIFVHLGYTTTRLFAPAEPSPPSMERFGFDGGRVVVS